MARLPVPGRDSGVWGDVLNDFLAVEHNTDGTLRLRADGPFYAKPRTGIPSSDLDAATRTALGQVATTVRKGELMVNAADYGVVGDNVTDNTANLQAAMNAAAAAGRILFLPSGAYRTRRLDVPNGLSMQGAASPGGYGITVPDAQHTRLVMIAGANDHLLHGTQGVAHVTLRHLHLDGNKNNNTSGDAIHLDDVGTAEEAQWHIHDCFIESAPGYGVYVGTGRRAAQTTSSTINYHGLSGIRQNGSDGHIRECVIGSNAVDGIQVGNSVTRVTDCDIYGNGTPGNSSTGNGVNVLSSINQVLLKGNGIDRNLTNGIYVSAGVNALSILANDLHSNSQDVNGGGHHINVKTTTGGVTIIGNVFGADSGMTKAAGYCVYLDTAATATAFGNTPMNSSSNLGLTNDQARLFRAASTGTYSARQTPGDANAGTLYQASDAGLYYSTGTAWNRATAVTKDGWLPAGAFACNVDRASTNMGNNTGLLVSGRLQLAGGIVVPAGKPVTSISFLLGNGAMSGQTHQWFCLIDQNGNVLGTTTDDTTTGWAGNTTKTLTLTTAWTPTHDTPVYCGLVLVATVMPDVRGPSSSTVNNGITPMMAASATTNLTDPTTLGANVGPLTAASVNPFCYIS